MVRKDLFVNRSPEHSGEYVLIVTKSKGYFLKYSVQELEFCGYRVRRVAERSRNVHS
jgi:hypothetical protein